MARESRIEGETWRRLREMKIRTVKCGKDGDPDRLILIGRSRHIWFEFKQPGGSLTPAQKRRIPKMRAEGEIVYIVERVDQGVQAAALHAGRTVDFTGAPRPAWSVALKEET